MGSLIASRIPQGSRKTSEGLGSAATKYTAAFNQGEPDLSRPSSVLGSLAVLWAQSCGPREKPSKNTWVKLNP